MTDFEVYNGNMDMLLFLQNETQLIFAYILCVLAFAGKSPGGDVYKRQVLPRMAALREPCDQAEACTAENYWPFPTYGELLFGVK